MTQNVVLAVKTSAAASTPVYFSITGAAAADVVACAEPAEMAADEVLPRVRKCGGRSLDVSGDVLGEVAEVHRRPAWIDDVDEHQRVVVRQVDVDVVGRGVGAVPV